MLVQRRRQWINITQIEISRSMSYRPVRPGSAWLGYIWLYINPLTVSARGSTLDVKARPRTERVKHKYWLYTNKIGIQMKRKELTKTFMMISD